MATANDVKMDGSSAASKTGSQLKPATMQFLLPPSSSRNMRSPSRESITSDFSVMSMSSNVGLTDNPRRRRGLRYFAKSRETLSGQGFDRLSLNVSMDVPLMTNETEDFFIAIPTSKYAARNAALTRCFSFSNIRSNVNDDDDYNLEDVTALSDPSLSVNSDFDDEISMFFDDREEVISMRQSDKASATAAPLNGTGDSFDDGPVTAPTGRQLKAFIVAQPILPANGKRANLRQRIKRKFLKFSINELLHRRKSKKSPLPELEPRGSATDQTAPQQQEHDASGRATSPKLPPKSAHNNVFPDQSKSKTLTDHDIEREQGRALSKNSRNLMIFNWLQNAEENGRQNQAF